MRILMDPGDFGCRNLGDVAMMQVAATRLQALFPGAAVEMLTHDAAALARRCPGVLPIPESGRESWFDDQNPQGRLHAILPAPASRALARMRRGARHRHPLLLERAIRARRRLHGGGGAELRAFLDAVRHTDLLVVNGQGTITDHLPSRVSSLLGTIELVLRRGSPVVMLGQGIGPLEDAALRRTAAGVLPGVALLALREGLYGPALVAALGVPAERVLLTGDDAIELAHARRPSGPGAAIGVNLRLARSSAVADSAIAPLGAVLGAFAAAVGAPLLPVPIASGPQGDAASIRRLLAAAGVDAAAAGDGGATLETPEAVIAQVGYCRIVVTGAYHAAVFALSQGIPAVCLSGSSYFDDKFLGLAYQFGHGCTVVSLRAPDFPRVLAADMERAWTAAAELRAPLLAAAERQIAASRAAFARLPLLVRAAAPPAHAG